MSSKPHFLLTEDDIYVDEFGGVIPNGAFLVKIYCKKMRKGTEIRQQILSALKLQRLAEDSSKLGDTSIASICQILLEACKK